jgi:hypothetical protein
MRRPNLYTKGVEWIAENDNAGDAESAEAIAGYVSTLLLADLFDEPPADVARDVVRYRAKHGLDKAARPSGGTR